MGLVQQAFQSEVASLSAMTDSLGGVLSQIEEFGPNNNGIMIVSCPEAAQVLASIAAGQVSNGSRNETFLAAVAGDLGHDVSFGLRNAQSSQKVARRSVSQPVTLAEGVSWSDVAGVIEVGMDYMNQRISRLS